MKKFFVFTIIIILMSILSLTLIIEENNTLENNKIEKDKMYAIMVQNEDKTGYIESTSNVWPSKMILNEELTNCIDEQGTKVNNALTYEEGNVIVETNKKIYCYLYFDAIATFGDQILQNSPSGLNTTLEAGLYRYQGTTNVDNYICFGTSTRTTCTGNPDAYMYRIIGIDEDGRVKLIKKEALNSKMQHMNNQANTQWHDSKVYHNINSSSFLTSTTYVPSGWETKIDFATWKYGDQTLHGIGPNLDPDSLYNKENAAPYSKYAKIGLMYLYDYAYAYQSGGLNCSSSGQYGSCKTAWIHLSNNDSNPPSTHEWLMSRWGLNGDGNSSLTHVVLNSGSVGFEFHSTYYSVRPVFFLKSNIQVISGTGKSNDPFIIS